MKYLYYVVNRATGKSMKEECDKSEGSGKQNDSGWFDKPL
jgi:hypothetical protein